MSVDRLGAAVAAAAHLPGVFGAVLCDHEGEAVIARFGPEPLPEAALHHVASQVPKAVREDAASSDYLLRLAGAEPCAMLALMQQRSERAEAGAIEGVEIGYRRVRVALLRLPEDYYLAVFARAGAVSPAWVRRVLDRVRPALEAEVG